MESKVKPFYFPIISILIPLSLWVNNSSIVVFHEIAIIFVVLIIVSLVIFSITGALTKRYQQAALSTSILITLFFCYEVSPKSLLSFREPFWILILSCGFIAPLLFKKISNELTKFLNAFSCILVCIVIFPFFRQEFESAKIRNQRETNIGGKVVKIESPPDVYYIIADGFGREDVLNRKYLSTPLGLNAKLEDLGFFVATGANSNYSQTELSLASTLNMQYLSDTFPSDMDPLAARKVLDKQITDSLVVSTFKKLGYEYWAITSGFPALKFQEADVVVGAQSGFDLYLNTLQAKTMIPFSETGRISMFNDRQDRLLNSFKALEAQKTPRLRPRFLLVHLLAPHPPFVFGPNGELRRPLGPFGLWDGSHYMGIGGTRDSYKQGYADQVTYISKRIYSTVKKIRQSNPNAIILIQGDHGPKMDTDYENISKTDHVELFGILSAYYVPASVKAKLYDGITPVNSFRTILSTLYGLDLPMLKDSSFYSTWEKPLDFTDISNRLKANELPKNE